MSVRSGQSITKVFTTRVFSTGVATNADSTPTGTLYVNGTADAASVTVTNVATGIYKAAVTLPTLAVGDVVDLRIAATVSSVADTEVIWSDTKDLVIDSAGLTDANVVKLGPSGSGTSQTARDIGASVLLSSGTGTGQLDFTSGVVKANATQFAGQAITAAAGVTIPSSIASPTNITAGTITTATNLTNLPSIPAGWLTASGIAASALNGKGDWNTTAPDNTTIGTIATNIGTNGAGLTAIGDTRLNNLDAAVSTRLATAGYTAPDNATITAINSKTTNLPSDPADASDIAAAFSAVNSAIAALNDLSANDLFTSQMTESYAADGTAPTLAQCLFLIQQSLHEFSISSTTRTVKKLDGSTTAAVFTLDSATAPTSTTRTA